jgi:hypothetical protein
VINLEAILHKQSWVDLVVQIDEISKHRVYLIVDVQFGQGSSAIHRPFKVDVDGFHSLEVTDSGNLLYNYTAVVEVLAIVEPE